jgi:hypothetical protein
MPGTKTAQRGRPSSPPVPADARRLLRRYKRKIAEGHAAAEARAEIMRVLRERGCSFDSIAEAAQINREGVRRSVLRRSEGGYPPDQTNGAPDA